MKSFSFRRLSVLVLFMPLMVLGALGGKPVALMGFGTDVKYIEYDVTDLCRYKVERLSGKWVDPAAYDKYSVLYFGEKLRGESQGKNWRDPETLRFAEKFIEGGGTVIVAGRVAMRELFGKPDGGALDALREKVIFIDQSLGRLKVNFGKADKPLSFADEAGNDILTEEGRQVEALRDRFVAAFKQAKNVELLPEGEKWETIPLGEKGRLKSETAFPRHPKLGKAPVRKDGLVLFGDGMKAVIVVPPEESQCTVLADELAWHLEKMSGERFEIVDRAPDAGPALVYRTLERPAGFERGSAAYMKIWREGDRVYLAGEDTGSSRATTYILEALGCRYLWPGETGKVIPRKKRIVLPDIEVEDATPLVIRRARLYRWPEFRDQPENRDFWRWHGMNDMSFMTTDKPRDSDGYQWGHYFGDYYPKYKASHPEFFALQPDGFRNLRLGARTERPTFCLSNQQLAVITARRKIEELKANPNKKAVSLCLPDGATSSWCMCEECRKLDPVNAAPGGVTVYFPERRRLPYVAMTDRVLTFMNRVAEQVAVEFPDKLLSTYAYSSYTAAPVKVKPHPNLLILSVAGNYSDTNNYGKVESNLAAWAGFGNQVLWRPNAHGGFRVNAPDNFARRMFADISLLIENGIFGVDYDTMYSDWAMKPFCYYVTTKAHFNPDKLDYETIAEDYCRSGFGAAAKEVRDYFDAVERAVEKAAAANAADKEPSLGWTQRVRRRNRLLEALDFDLLDDCVTRARQAAHDDAEVLTRLERLQFANDVGRFTARLNIGKPTKPTDDEVETFKKTVSMYLRKDPAASSRLLNDDE